MNNYLVKATFWIEEDTQVSPTPVGDVIFDANDAGIHAIQMFRDWCDGLYMDRLISGYVQLDFTYLG